MPYIHLWIKLLIQQSLKTRIVRSDPSGGDRAAKPQRKRSSYELDTLQIIADGNAPELS
jgi:hypothetical protein